MSGCPDTRCPTHGFFEDTCQGCQQTAGLPPGWLAELESELQQLRAEVARLEHRLDLARQAPTAQQLRARARPGGPG